MNTKRVIIFFIFAIGGILAVIFLPLGAIKAFNISDSVVGAFIQTRFIDLLIGVGIYAVFLTIIGSYLATWATVVKPLTVAAPASKEALTEKFLALNSPDIPWQIRRGEKTDLIAEWKIADAKWLSAFAANKIQIVHLIRLRLDSKKKVVHAQDVERRARWSAGAGAPSVSLSWSGFRGIVFFQYERAAEFGVTYKDEKLRVGPAYDYRFSLQEMKNPLIEVAIGNGWIWKGALTVSPFWSRIFGG